MQQTLFRLEVEPLQWGPDKISFKTCENLEELLLVITFIIRHNMEVKGKLLVMFYKSV